MLRSLHIENYALIRSLDITFDDGFTVITGETGAGKSILLGALSLILGNRADTAVLYDKTKKCYVEGEFDITHLGLSSFFEMHNLDYLDITLLRREISSIGKSRAFINDTPVTLQVLKELAVRLVDIHSQHQNLLLNNPLFRINILDEFARTSSLLQEYSILYADLKRIEKELREALEEQKKAWQDQDYLTYVYQELLQAELQEGGQEEAEQQLLTLSNAETIKTKLFHASQLFSEQEASIVQLLKESHKEIETVAPYNHAIESIKERISQLIIETQDIAYDIAKIEENTPVDPELLESLQQKLDKIYFLQQKHHVSTIEELIEKRDEFAKKLHDIEDNSYRIEELTKKEKEITEQTRKKAEELSKKRHDFASPLEKELEQKLQLLGMSDARFHIAIQEKENLSENGVDEVRFYFSANKGNEPEEIAKVASGGELSRMMLAIKSVISESSMLPTVIFDEIDTGISGEVAEKVGRMMKEISLQRQLLAITHLPQIAAKGNLHYFVYKEVIEGKTYTNIRKLTKEERINELAMMMGMGEITNAARNLAKELLK